MNAKEFQEKLVDITQKAVLKNIYQGFVIDYDSRFSVPKEFMEEIWDSLDKDKLKAEIKNELEKKVAEQVVKSIASEISHDIKKVLTKEEYRNKIKEKAKEIIEEISKK